METYRAATKEFVPGAEGKIVFDRFHVMRQVTEAVDKIRRQEHKLLMAQGEEFLKGTKHLWLMNEERILDWRKPAFDEIRKMKLKTAKAWAMKESLRHFWDYRYPESAEKYSERWVYASYYMINCL